MDIGEIIKQSVIEDLGDGDHTSLATIPSNARKKAQLIIKEDGVLAGLRVARLVFNYFDKEIKFRSFIKDGEKIIRGDIVFEVEGNAINILSAERLALNFMQRMSGIASYTRKITDLISGTSTKILDTRKTTPLLRELEKEAVRLGGGHNHRFGLYDMIMIKDNHIDFAGGIKQAILSTKKYLTEKDKNLKIEIEVRNINELDQVLSNGGVHRIMLDNFTPEQTKIALKKINQAYETESSGGIHYGNISEYAKTGVDFISVGALTHQINSLDMSLIAIK